MAAAKSITPLCVVCAILPIIFDGLAWTILTRSAETEVPALFSPAAPLVGDRVDATARTTNFVNSKKLNFHWTILVLLEKLFSTIKPNLIREQNPIERDDDVV